MLLLLGPLLEAAAVAVAGCWRVCLVAVVMMRPVQPLLT
jgi:hypothetical protein